MAVTYSELSNSTYLDDASYRSGADPLSGGTAVAHITMNVALVFDRANDPTALLSNDWGTRQQELATLKANGHCGRPTAPTQPSMIR